MEPRTNNDVLHGTAHGQRRPSWNRARTTTSFILTECLISEGGGGRDEGGGAAGRRLDDVLAHKLRAGGGVCCERARLGVRCAVLVLGVPSACGHEPGLVRRRA
jgi:hypothetical protein